MSDEPEKPAATLIGSAAVIMSFFGGIMVLMVLLSLPGPPPPRGMTSAQQIGIAVAGSLLLLSGALTRRGVFAGMVLGNLCFGGWIVYAVAFGWSRLSMPLCLLMPVYAAVPVLLWLQMLKALRLAWRQRNGTA